MGRPRADDREVFNGILYVLRTGCWWKDMPREYGAYAAAWRRLERWQREQVWDQIWQAILASLDREGKLDSAREFLDGSFVPAKGRRRSRSDQCWQGNEAHAGHGWGRDVVGVSGQRANRAEVKLAEAALDRIRVPRERGQPRKRPERSVADRAHDCDSLRRWLRGHGVRPCIPPRRNRRGHRKGWEEEYRERWHVERTFAWVGTYCRLLVRHERLLLVYAGFFTLACIRICLGKLGISVTRFTRSTFRLRCSRGRDAFGFLVLRRRAKSHIPSTRRTTVSPTRHPCAIISGTILSAARVWFSP